MRAARPQNLAPLAAAGALGGNSRSTPKVANKRKPNTRNPQNFAYEVSHLRGSWHDEQAESEREKAKGEKCANEAAVNSCKLATRSATRTLALWRTQPAVVTAELFDEHEIREFHDGPRLSASKRMVNVRPG
jgi:hypothetical protein